jgi:signal peptidase I
MQSTFREMIKATIRNWQVYSKARKVIIGALIVATVTQLFFLQPFIVSGDSMLPTYKPGDRLVIDRLAYALARPQVGDVVVFQYPFDPSLYFIKRIDALPGDIVVETTGAVVASGTISNANPLSVTASARTLTLARDEYFVLGDNRDTSSDSRAWGPLQQKFIVGRVTLRFWPLVIK